MYWMLYVHLLYRLPAGCKKAQMYGDMASRGNFRLYRRSTKVEMTRGRLKAAVHCLLAYLRVMVVTQKAIREAMKKVDEACGSAQKRMSWRSAER